MTQDEKLTCSPVSEVSGPHFRHKLQSSFSDDTVSCYHTALQIACLVTTVSTNLDQGWQSFIVL